jgi:NAD(P)-dependent dehydrogenase (short-subunit alcohol dehydrogenase family)
MGKLEGKVAVITGATSGMGLATARRFVAEGAYVFITGRRQEQLNAAVKEIGRNVFGVQGDAGNLADLDQLYDTVKAQKGHIDVLYASAGFGEFNVPLGSITEANFDNTFNVNVAFHGAEGATADVRWRIDHHDRLDRQRERL